MCNYGIALGSMRWVQGSVKNGLMKFEAEGTILNLLKGLDSNSPERRQTRIFSTSCSRRSDLLKPEIKEIQKVIEEQEDVFRDAWRKHFLE